MKLMDLVDKGRRITLLTGAGVSTLPPTNLPDYRGPNGAYSRSNHRPMIWSTFLSSDRQRRRYWLRSFVGYEVKMARIQPNRLHLALATHLTHVPLITQNVDGMHVNSRNNQVVELHGSVHRIRCLECGAVGDRRQWQRRMSDLNPFLADLVARIESMQSERPDGDYELSEEEGERELQLPSCDACQSSASLVKPDVVFFGDSVDSNITALAESAIDQCEQLIVMGTTLSTHSSWRLVRRALDGGARVLIVNKGEVHRETTLRKEKLITFIDLCLSELIVE